MQIAFGKTPTTDIRSQANCLLEILLSSKLFFSSIELVSKSSLPDWWLCGGLIRSNVWGHLMKVPVIIEEIDVIYFDKTRTDQASDKNREDELGKKIFGVPLSVTNQARKWKSSNDQPYNHSTDGLLNAPDTVSSIGLRKEKNAYFIFAPYGLADLFEMRIAPTMKYLENHDQTGFVERVNKKKWLISWPKAKLEFTPRAVKWPSPIMIGEN